KALETDEDDAAVVSGDGGAGDAAGVGLCGAAPGGRAGAGENLGRVADQKVGGNHLATGRSRPIIPSLSSRPSGFVSLALVRRFQVARAMEEEAFFAIALVLLADVLQRVAQRLN